MWHYGKRKWLIEKTTHRHCDDYFVIGRNELLRSVSFGAKMKIKQPLRPRPPTFFVSKTTNERASLDGKDSGDSCDENVSRTGRYV